MKCQGLYMTIVIATILYFISTCKIKEQFNGNRKFTYSTMPYMLPYMMPYMRHFPIYQDIRGSPNAVYETDTWGSLIHIGYKFGPYMYNTQGNRVKHGNHSHIY